MSERVSNDPMHEGVCPQCRNGTDCACDCDACRTAKAGWAGVSEGYD
jgi:hypothetical protein